MKAQGRAKTALYAVQCHSDESTMHCKWACRLLIIGLSLSISISSLQVQALTIEEQGAQQSEQLFREQQRRLKMQERERLFRELERSLQIIEIPAPAEKPKDKVDQFCFTITTIEFEGADNLYKIEKDRLKKPYLYRCLSLNDIDALRTDIDRFYIEKGWIMARTYLQPNQNIKSGTLIFQVLEGVLESIELNKNTTRDAMQIATAFPDMQNEITYIRDIEQGLDQMNRLASNRATMSIEPVKNKPGYSKILINNTVSNQHRFYLGYDNQGSKSTGRERGKLTMDLDNLISVNDNWYISATDYIGDGQSKRGSKSYSLNYSMPFGYWTYNVSRNHSEYTSAVENQVQSFQTSGESNNYTIKVSRVAHRGKQSKTTLSTTLISKETDSFLEDVKLETSSRKLSIFDLGLNHVIRMPAATWSISINYSRGLDLFDALQDGPESGNNIPKAQFEKLTWDISMYAPIKAWGDQWVYQGLWAGQVSGDPLFGSEQISIGDVSSIRGFRDSIVSGEAGIYFKNDFNWRVISNNYALKNLSLGVGVDAGYVKAKNNNIANTDKDGATLAGLSLGAYQTVRFAKRQNLDWSLTISKPVLAPAFIKKENLVVYFNLNWKWW